MITIDRTSTPTVRSSFCSSIILLDGKPYIPFIHTIHSLTHFISYSLLYRSDDTPPEIYILPITKMAVQCSENDLPFRFSLLFFLRHGIK